MNSASACRATCGFPIGRIGAPTPRISNSVHITGDDASHEINVVLPAAGEFFAAGWTFAQWVGADHLNFIGSPGADTITGCHPRLNARQ